MEKTPLDKQDKRLLYELSKAPSETLVELAKRSGLSKDQVAYRLSAFEKNEVILRYHSLIPLERLGIGHYRIALKLRSASREKIERLLSFLGNYSRVTWVVRIQGEFDFDLSLRCFSPQEVSEFIDILLEKFGDLLLKKTASIYSSIEYFERDYLIGKKSRPLKTKDNKRAYPVHKLDRVDYFILEKMAENSRIRPSEVARDLEKEMPQYSLTREAIAYRVKKLEHSGWLSSTWLAVNPLYNSLYYKVDIRLEQVGVIKIEHLLNFCRSHPRVVFFVRMIGEIDYEVHFEAESHDQVHAFIMELTEKSPDCVRDYTLSLITELHKWGYSQVIKAAAERNIF